MTIRVDERRHRLVSRWGPGAAPLRTLPRVTLGARHVASTYTYAALGQPTSKSHSEGTAANFYDEPSVTVGGTNYPLTNTKGRPAKRDTPRPLMEPP